METSKKPLSDNSVSSHGNDINDNKNVDAKAMFEELHKKALMMGLKQHQLRRLQFVQNVRQAKWRQFQRYALRTCTALIFAAIAIVAMWTMDWPLTRRNMAQLIWRIRGEKLAQVEAEFCLFKVSNVIQDLARPPVDCEFCEGVSRVAKVSRISQSEFEENFAYSGQPVVVTDGAANWSAVHMFSFEFFKGIYKPDSPVLDSQCQFFPYQTEFNNLSHVFQMDTDRASLRDGSQPWYIGWSNCDITAANILRQHYIRPYFLPTNSESSKTDWIFMGSPGYGAHMHIDNVGLPSWQAQITGHKTWVLEAPPECLHLCSSQMTATVHPGEIIVLDTNKWFHSTLVQGDDISITIGSEFD